MSFTFTAVASPTSTENTFENATVGIAVSPAAAIIQASAMLPGGSADGSLLVSNTGDVDLLYFISADWSAAAGTSASLAAILASKISANVAVGATELYAGPISGLVDQPAEGRSLTTVTISEQVDIALTLPAEANNLLQGRGLNIDFLFVGTQE